MACALLDTVLGRLAEEGKAAYEVLETYKGTDLEGKEYEPLYQCAADCAQKQNKKAFYVVCDEYVTLTDGTGVVHIAPAFGEDDANVGRKYDLPFVQLVDEKGNMAEETPFAGLFVKKADPEVLKDLDARGLLYDAPKFEHSYPHCWRCDTPLIYYARESWFIKMTAVKEDCLYVEACRIYSGVSAFCGDARISQRRIDRDSRHAWIGDNSKLLCYGKKYGT